MATNVITIEGKDDNLGTGIHFNQWIQELSKYGTIRRHIIMNAGHYEPVFDPQSLKELMPERAAFLN
jgi:hypothetical protein